VKTIEKTTQVLSCGGNNIESLPAINRISALLLVHFDSHDTKKRKEVSKTMHRTQQFDYSQYLLGHPLHLLPRHIRRIPPARRLRQQSHIFDVGDAFLPSRRSVGLGFDGFGVLFLESRDHVYGRFHLGFDDCGAI
jgi:hypothetical protein